MAWSIREIAALAGTSRRAVRHYNDIGLLELPARETNGHKRYGIEHLVRLLQIRHLVDLGFSLSRIAAMGGQGAGTADALRSLDAELAATIERRRRARTDIGLMLADGAPTELPPAFVPAPVRERMNDADRSFVVVMSRVLGPDPLRAYSDLLHTPSPDPAARAFDDLPADADDRSCRELAVRMAAYVRDIRARHPALRDLHAGSPHGTGAAAGAIATAKRELYNPAQREVMRRTGALLARSP